MSGIAFGVFEGVQYQTTINAQADYTTAFLLNVARLTSRLPARAVEWHLRLFCGLCPSLSAIPQVAVSAGHRHSCHVERPLRFVRRRVLSGLADDCPGQCAGAHDLSQQEQQFQGAAQG